MAAPSITQVSTLQHCSCPQTKPIVGEIIPCSPQTQTCKPLLDSPLIGGLSCLDFRSHHFDCSLPTFLHLKTPSVSLSLENTGSNPIDFHPNFHFLLVLLKILLRTAGSMLAGPQVVISYRPQRMFHNVPHPLQLNRLILALHARTDSGDLGISILGIPHSFKSVFTSTSNVLT